MDVFYLTYNENALTQEWLDLSKRCSTAELSCIKKDSYQNDNSSHIKTMSIPPIMENKGSQTTYM